MNEIFKKYETDLENFEKEKAEISAKQEHVRAKIVKLNKQLEELEKKHSNLYRHKPTHYDLIEALAKKMSEYYGLPYEISGPFGLECETSIYLRKDMTRSICDQKTISLSLRAYDGRYGDSITYDTGERIDKYPEGSIGAFNGGNSVFAPLPTDFNEILKLVKVSEREDIEIEGNDNSIEDIIENARRRAANEKNSGIQKADIEFEKE